MPSSRRHQDINQSIPDSTPTIYRSSCVRCGYPINNHIYDDCCPDGEDHQYTPSAIATKIASIPHRHNDDYPLWAGPCDAGPLGGITQSMLVRFLSCRDRFRLKYVCGLELLDKWNKNIGYGNMWHVCEEFLAKKPENEQVWIIALQEYSLAQCKRYSMQQEEITKWYNVCMIQFPEYIKYWADHPDVKNRTPLMQEQVFDVPYTLPSGRVVRLRGKFDSVDLIDGGIWLQENKTKGDIDKSQVERQLKFDLQTMLYLIALQNYKFATSSGLDKLKGHRLGGVRYNVVRRPMSGGKGSIRPHAAKSTKTKFTPAETSESFYERLRQDYIAAEPDYWFFRVRTEVNAKDIQVFRDTCLDPLLEELCWWYDSILLMGGARDKWEPPSGHYRTPFGVYSALEENGSTEYDAFLENGSESGLRRVETLFTELQ